MNNGGERDMHEFGTYSDAQLRTLKARAEDLLAHPEKPRRGRNPEMVLRQVNQEISERKLRSADTASANREYKWTKQGDTHTLAFRGESAAIIRVVANHSLNNRDVYYAELFG